MDTEKDQRQPPNDLEKKWDGLGITSYGHNTCNHLGEKGGICSKFSCSIHFAFRAGRIIIQSIHLPTRSSCPWSFCALMDAWYAASLKILGVRHWGISILDRFLLVSAHSHSWDPGTLHRRCSWCIYDRGTGGSQQALNNWTCSDTMRQKLSFWCAPMMVCIIVYGCFQKWWYPQNTPKWSFSVGKPLVVGYHHFRKPPYVGIYTPINPTPRE